MPLCNQKLARSFTGIKKFYSIIQAIKQQDGRKIWNFSESSGNIIFVFFFWCLIIKSFCKIQNQNIRKSFSTSEMNENFKELKNEENLSESPHQSPFNTFQAAPDTVSSTSSIFSISKILPLTYCSFCLYS